MAIRLDAAADRLLRTTDLLSYDANYSLSCWFLFPANPAAGSYNTIFCINANNGTGPLDWYGIARSGSSNFLTIYLQDNGGAFSEYTGATNLVAGTWYHLGVIRSASNARAVYLNGVLQVSGTVSLSGRTAPTRMEFGAFTSGNTDPFNGRVAAVKLWAAALTAAEIDAERFTVRPVRWDNLHLFTPLFGSTTLEDWSGAGRAWTAAGTLTTEDGPPVSWGGRAVIPQAAAGGGGTTYNATLGGALGLAGALVGQARLSRAGALASAGALIDQTRRALAGAIAPGGALTPSRLFVRGVSGAASSAGALTTAAGAVRAVSGAIASDGATGRRPARALVGALASAGALIRQAQVARSGSFSAGRSLRFYGTATGGIDRVRFPLTASGGTVATAINVGAGAFTYEFWLRCRYADNPTSETDVRFSNIILDRDVWNDNRGHVPVGVTRNGAVLVLISGFNVGGTWSSLRGSTNIGDDAWHHIAISRSGTAVRGFVDGNLEFTLTVSSGSYAYPTGYTPTGGADNEFLVLGAEKHDFIPEAGGFDGFVDDLRISSISRYSSSFTPPTANHSIDANTVGLYRFDSTSGTVAVDATGNVNGELRVGGPNNGPTWTTGGPFAGSGISGTLSALRVLLRTFAGATTSSGTIQRQARGERAGALTSAGALVRQGRKALVGALTSAGALTRRPARALAGALSPSGLLDAVRSGVVALAGALTPAGALVDQARRLLTGALTPAGALSEQTRRALAGAVASAGAVARLAGRGIGGALPGAGALAAQRVLLRALAGSVAAAGALARQARALRDGAISAAGALLRGLRRGLAGALAGVGALVRSGASAVVRPPRARTLAIPAERRRLDAPAEARRLDIPAEARRLDVPSED